MARIYLEDAHRPGKTKECQQKINTAHCTA